VASASDPWGVEQGAHETASAPDPWGINSKGKAAPVAALSPSLPTSGKPKKISAVEAFSDITDVPLNLGSALIESDVGQSLEPIKNAWNTLRTKGPHALNEAYNPQSQQFLTRLAPRSGVARAELKYPALRAAGSFLTESANPSNLLFPAVGGVVGRALKPAAEALSKAPGISQALSEFDRFKGMRDVAGDEGESLGRSMVNEAGKAGQKAKEHTERIFGPVGGKYLTKDEKIEIVRRSQGLKPKSVVVAGRGAVDRLSSDADLTARARDLRKTLKATDIAQMNAHPELLAKGRRFNPETYFPMAGQYRDPGLSDEAAQFLDEFRPGSGAGIKTVKGTAGAHGGHKTNLTLDQALSRPDLLREDFDPAQSLYTHLARRGRNVAFEQSIQKAPPSLARMMEFEGRPTSGMAPQRLNIEQFRHWGPQAREQFLKATEGMKQIVPPGHVSAEDVQRTLGSSPSAAERTFHPAFVKFIQDAGATQPEAQGVGALFEAFNHLARIGVITNPVVHVGWNLLGNYLGAKGDPAKLGYVATGKGWEEAAKWDKLADQHGAHAAFTTRPVLGGETARIMTGGGTSKVPGLDALNRKLTKGWERNQDFVFGTMEKRFSNALFADNVKRLEAAGVTGEDAYRRAGIEVRKALGDYVDVGKGNIESALNKGMFFYPWMKTILPFAMKTMVQNPSWITKPTRAVQAWNQGMGDPNDQTTMNRVYLGKWKGQDQYLSAPFPQRYAEAPLALGLPGGNPRGSLQDRLKPSYTMLMGHLNPGLSTGAKVINTMAAPATEPGGANYNILFDKAAPIGEQVKQGLGSVLGPSVPLPLQGLGEGIQGTLQGNPAPFAGTLGGTTYSRPSQALDKVLHGERVRMLREVGLFRQIGRDDLAASAYAQYKALEDKLIGPGGNR
jgi:hypothetical protein